MDYESERDAVAELLLEYWNNQEESFDRFDLCRARYWELIQNRWAFNTHDEVHQVLMETPNPWAMIEQCGSDTFVEAMRKYNSLPALPVVEMLSFALYSPVIERLRVLTDPEVSRW